MACVGITYGVWLGPQMLSCVKRATFLFYKHGLEISQVIDKLQASCLQNPFTRHCAAYATGWEGL
jgi:hypothetical protein